VEIFKIVKSCALEVVLDAKGSPEASVLKRIRVHQLRVGMFVMEAEFVGAVATKRFSPFMISSVDDVSRLMDSNLMTVVIDVRKRPRRGIGRLVATAIRRQFL
jgi:hypothetical protein